MQPNKNDGNKAPAPARSTLFHVYSAGVSPIDNKPYAVGLAFNIDNDKYEPMAVALSDEEELAEFYSKIYPEQSQGFTRALASNEARLTSANSTRNDYSIRGVIRNTIESGVLHANKKSQPIDLQDLSKIDKTMLDDIKGRFVLALDNLEVTHEGEINGQTMKIGRATRAQAMNIHSQTTQSSVVQALGYLDYTPPYLGKDNEHNVRLKTFEAGAQSTVGQLAGDNKHKMLEVMELGLKNKLDVYGLPNAERNGTLDIQINFTNDKQQKEEYSLSVQPYLDLATHYNENVNSYRPRVDGDKFLNDIVDGIDYHTVTYKKHLEKKSGEPLPRDLIDKVAKHDFIRFLHKAVTNYDDAMQGNCIQALYEEDRMRSADAMNLGRVQEMMVRAPNQSFVSFESVTNHLLHSVTKRQVLASKNSEFVSLLKQKEVDEKTIAANTMGRLSVPSKSLNSMVLSNLQVDAAGVPKKADIVGDVMVSLVQTSEDSNAVVRSVRSIKATGPDYPQMHKIERTDARGNKVAYFNYVKGTPTFVSTKAMPDGAAREHLHVIETTNNHDSKYNPVNIESNTAALETLKSGLGMTSNLSLLEDEYRQQFMMRPMPVPTVNKPYYLNAAVERKDINTNVMPNNKNALITDRQKKMAAVILGNYRSQVGKDSAQGRDIAEMFNTDYKKKRVSEFLEEVEVRYPNFFMNKATAEKHGFEVYGGYNVAKGLLDLDIETPFQPHLHDPDDPNDKYRGMNIYKEFGDVVRCIVDRNVTDAELKRDFANPERAAKKANIHTAIPTAADTQSAKIDNLYPKAALGNEASANDLNALFGIGNEKPTVTTPRMPTESEKKVAVTNERSMTAAQIMRRPN